MDGRTLPAMLPIVFAFLVSVFLAAPAAADLSVSGSSAKLEARAADFTGRMDVTSNQDPTPREGRCGAP